MKQTIKRALAVFVAALLATMGPVGALSEGIVNGENMVILPDD